MYLLKSLILILGVLWAKALPLCSSHSLVPHLHPSTPSHPPTPNIPTMKPVTEQLAGPLPREAPQELSR